jgi:hypothetical protein
MPTAGKGKRPLLESRLSTRSQQHSCHGWAAEFAAVSDCAKLLC